MSPARAPLISEPCLVGVFYLKDFAGDDNYGVGVSYDLGGGAALKAGYADNESAADASYDFGISMSF